MRYNDNIQCLDMNKKPCALYITGENDVEETVQRMISYVGAVDEKGKAVDVDSALGVLKEHKLHDDTWEYRFLYRPKNSISTGDIDGIINEIEAEGEVEVKILVYDYLKRIKPDYPTGDMRLDIGEATNDFSILSKQRKIPVITANQLNREAYRVLQEVATEKKSNNGDVKKLVDGGRRIDQSMISESNMMLENADFVCAINKEYSMGDGKYYMTFKDLKNRSDKGTNSNPTDSYFAHPFEDGNSMRLVEDIDMDRSVSFDSIANTLGTGVDDDMDMEEDVDHDNGKSKKPKRTVVKRRSLASLDNP